MVLLYESDEIVTDPGVLMSELVANDPGGISQSGIPVTNFEGAILQGQADAAEMSASFVIVTRQKSPNRNGNMVQIAPSEEGRGLILDAYQQNPVVLFNHGEGFPLPIGRSADQSGNLALKIQKLKAIATVFFSQSNPFANDVFGLVNEGILKMASVGFMPQKAKRLKMSTERLADGVADISPGSPNSYFGGFDFVESDLMEWSIVAIGADPGALRQCLSAGNIGGEKIASPFFKFWLSQRAEAKPAIGRGFDSMQIRRSDEGSEAQSKFAFTDLEPDSVTVTAEGFTITGQADAVAVVVQKIKPVPVAEYPIESTPVDFSAQTPVNVAVVEQTAPVVQPDPLFGLLQSLPELLATEVQKGFTPCLQQLTKQNEALQMLTGRVPSN